jgi:cold shock CspA family protein
MAKDDDVTADAAPARRAVVAQLFAEDGYGFLLTPDNREVRFTRASVLRDEFDELRVGSEVSYAERQDSDGPSATAVDVRSIPLPPADGIDEQLGADDEVPEVPDEADQWQEK